MRHANARRGGFTLAEVAVTIVIVGIGLVMILQGINTAKITAAHTHNKKVARELALLTLAEIASGLYWDEMDERLEGTYAEQGYPGFYWEVVVGEDNFTLEDGSLAHDSYRWRKQQQEEEDRDEDEDDEDTKEPFEKVRIKVVYPRLSEFENELVIERWIPWAQVYGEDEEDVATEAGTEGSEGGGGGASTGQGGR